MVSSPSVSLAWMLLSLASLLRGILILTALQALARSAVCKQTHAPCQTSEVISTPRLFMVQAALGASMDIFFQARPLDTPARPPLRTSKEKAPPSPVNTVKSFCVSPGMHLDNFAAAISLYTLHSRSGQHRQERRGGGEGVHLNSRRGIVTNSAGLLLTGNQQHIILYSNTDILTSQPCKFYIYRQ